MASRTLAATAAATFLLAATAFAGSHPPPPTPTRVWLDASPIRVVETVNDHGTRRCTLDASTVRRISASRPPAAP
jgi:hypothetical protein